ncbi:MAG: transglutaminase domain-containing protein [Ruminococcus sp.]|nr:transglutaminase domain-containing protein [Ruminococcus sp.]
MSKTVISVPDKSQSKLYAVVCAVSSFLLVVCSLLCLVSSFNIKVNTAALIFFTLVFTGAFSAVSVVLKSKRKFMVYTGVVFLLIAVLVLCSYNTIAAQLNYTINSVLRMYSQYLNLPQSVLFATVKANATALFTLFSAVLSFLLTSLSIKTGKVFFSIAIPIIVIIPCFILVDTLPDLLPLLSLVAVMLTLFVSSAVCRANASKSIWVVFVVAPIMAALVAGVYLVNPVESFERKEWQDNLLLSATDLLVTGDYSTAQGPVAANTKNIKTEIDLTKCGPLKHTHTKVMTIDSNYSGRIYLKGLSYANYENNCWSILTDEQAQSYPENFDSFVMTKSPVPEYKLSIETKQKEDVLYTPYYLSEPGDPALFDILLKNSDGTKTYEMKFNPCTANELILEDSQVYYKIDDTVNSDAYKEFVYNNYLSVPQDVRDKLVEIAYNNHFDFYSNEGIVTSVKEYVSNSATYSLDTPSLPQGQDLALWFLNESETGYCVHFATTATLMLRSLGIPARYVSGYCVEYNSDNSDSLVVTTDNAHAWVEYFDADIGWVPLEATAGDFLVPVSAPAVEDTQQQSTQQQSTAVESVEPTSATETDSKTDTSKDQQTDTKEKTENKPVTSVIVAVSVLLLAVITLILRRKIVLLLRKKRFNTGSNNERAIMHYRYLLRLSHHVYVHIPEKVTDIVNKARYSSSQLTDSELELITKYTDARTKAVESDVSKVKKLYFEYILVII